MALIYVNGLKTTLKLEDTANTSDNSIFLSGDNIQIATKHNPEIHYPPYLLGTANQASATNLFLSADSTFLQSIRMNWPGTIGGTTPTTTLETVAITDSLPVLTIYWTITANNMSSKYVKWSVRSKGLGSDGGYIPFETTDFLAATSYPGSAYELRTTNIPLSLNENLILATGDIARLYVSRVTDSSSLELTSGVWCVGLKLTYN